MSNLRQLFRESPVAISASDAFDWHSRPGAFRRLVPPWEQVRIQKIVGTFGIGQQIEMKTKIFGPIWGTWLAEITEALKGNHFTDVQLKGPFAYWQHRHEFQPVGETASTLRDRIEYRVPLGFLGRLLGGRIVRKKLERMFSYRHRVTQNDFLMHDQFRDRPRLRFAVTGASGFVGSQLVALLVSQGHFVTRLVRSQKPKPSNDGTSELLWNPREALPSEAWNNIDVLIHLAGESVAEGRWTRRKKHRIYDSRIPPTKLLAESFGSAKRENGVMICASAVGFYGDRKDEILTEDSTSGDDFLAGVVRDWEAATNPAREQATRVANVRFGVVLSPSGGALKKQLLPFKMGIGGKLGNGRGYLPWVALDDLLYALLFIANTKELSGPINIVAPQEIQNAQWTKALGRVLHRPTIAPIPKLALKIAFGEMSSVLLASQRVKPAKLTVANFPFRYPTIDEALRHLFGKG